MHRAAASQKSANSASARPSCLRASASDSPAALVSPAQVLNRLGHRQPANSIAFDADDG